MEGWSKEEDALYFKIRDRLELEGKWVAEEKVKRKPTPRRDPIPYTEIAELYNDFAEHTNNPQIATMTAARKALIKKAWYFDSKNKKEKLRTNNLEYFRRLFDYAKQSEFLNGNTERPESHANWRPNFEFIFRDETHSKIREGSY